MFDEFCRGQDALLREFVQCGSELITVVPVDIQALSLAPLPPPPLMVPGPVEMHATEETTRSEVAPPPTLSTQRKRPGESEQRYVNGEEEVDDDTIGDRTRKRARAVSDNADDEAEAEAAAISVERAIHTTLLLSDDHVRASIMENFKRVEEKEPWKQAFNPDNLSMPFSRAKHPELAAALKEFWEKHSQAVWERKFWAPLSRSRTHSLHTHRRGRQSKAQNAFERNVLLAVYKKFGAGFFVQLDKRDTPESGWYYLDQVVDLFTLGRRCGLPACLQYIELEASKRFPVAPGLGRGFYSRVNGKSCSMWSSAYALQPVVKEIVALKAKENGAP
ncbi:unnamed protein product [Phytophthora lilii]|uniref:Unnamed protein product n=1 Tax=Phytophthora lilii TaxID=2077276 RepID=A0A9W6TIB4_9STRA|nr:unnamed protein product [Phytophthora lilii]